MKLRDALCEDPLDPHLEAVSSVPYVLIFGALFAFGVSVSLLISGMSVLGVLCAFSVVWLPALLLAGLQYLSGLCFLRRRERALQSGTCMTGEILGTEYVGGSRTGFWVSGIRLPDGREFFSPHYQTSPRIYQICDVYIYRHRRYLTNFRRKDADIRRTEEQI